MPWISRARLGGNLLFVSGMAALTKPAASLIIPLISNRKNTIIGGTKEILEVQTMQKQILITCLAILAGCAATDWVVIDDVKHEGKQIAALRAEVSKPNLVFSDILVIRMKTEAGTQAEVTSIAPSVISAQKDGPPAARTTFAIAPKRDALVLFTQDVPHWKAFRKEIPVTDLVPGKTFRFPVVQASGEIQTQTFAIEKIITQ